MRPPYKAFLLLLVFVISILLATAGISSVFKILAPGGGNGDPYFILLSFAISIVKLLVL